MSRTIITTITLGVVLSAIFVLRWQRHFIMRCLCPSEIFLLESVEERNRVCDRGYIAFLKHWRTWITFVIYSAALALTSLALSGLTIAVSRVGQWSRTGVKLAAILCVVVPLHLIPLMFARYRKWMRVFLREYLNDHGIPICRNCGYDLRGQTSRCCPECGMAFVGKDAADDLLLGGAEQSRNGLSQVGRARPDPHGAGWDGDDGSG